MKLHTSWAFFGTDQSIMAFTFMGPLKSHILKWCAQDNEFSFERRNILTIFHTIDFPLSRLAQPLDALHAPFHSWNRPEYRLEILAQIDPNISWTHHSWDSWLLMVHWSNQMVQLWTRSAQTESEMQFLGCHHPWSSIGGIQIIDRYLRKLLLPSFGQIGHLF